MGQRYNFFRKNTTRKLQLNRKNSSIFLFFCLLIFVLLTGYKDIVFREKVVTLSRGINKKHYVGHNEFHIAFA